MAKKGDLVFNLGQEELLFLLNLLQASTTLGIEPDIYKELNEREIAVAVEVTGRALIARGFIRPNGRDSYIMDEVPLALVGTCTRPSYTIIIDIVKPETKLSIFWHGTEHLSVEHSIIFPGIHKFRALAAPEELPIRLSEHLPIPSGGKLPMMSVKKMNRDVYIQARDLAISKQSDAAEMVFLQNGVAETDAKTFVKVIMGAETTYTIGFIRHARPEQVSSIRGGALIISSVGCCIVESLEEEDKGNEVVLMPSSTDLWKNWLLANLAWVRE